jgi:GT2 family glycosyltransferase
MPPEVEPASLPAAGGGAPILSVLIVTYRSRHEIGECLASIPRQISGRSVEIIVVDNHSDDGTAGYVSEHFSEVRVVPLPENCGFSKANNVALAAASGETILFLNPDTVVTLAALQACLERLAAEPQIGIISPRLEIEPGVIDPACRRSIPTIWDGFTRASGLSTLFPKSAVFAGYNLTYLPEDGTYEVGAVNGAFMMITRRVLDRVGPLDEQFFMYGEDLDFCYRCQLAGYRVVYVWGD